MQNPESEWFGHKKVTAEEKTRLVRGVFDSVADKYDLMNDLMSGGVHRIWKNRLIRMIRPRADWHYLDVAGGTGDIAFRLRAAAGPEANITLCDLDYNMLSVGRDRAINKAIAGEFDWITGNAEALPIADNTIDIYTIAFGLRNVARIDTALAEAYRVLRPGGRFYCLEFSRVEEPLLARIYDSYSYRVIPRIGQAVAKDRDSYQYLVESIRQFPDQKTLAKRMQKAGFDNVRYTDFTFGVAAVHQGWKT